MHAKQEHAKPHFCCKSIKKKYRQKGKILTPSPYNEYIFISADISSCVNREEQKFKD